MVGEGQRGLAADAPVEPHVAEQAHENGLVLVKVEDLWDNTYMTSACQAKDSLA